MTSLTMLRSLIRFQLAPHIDPSQKRVFAHLRIWRPATLSTLLQNESRPICEVPARPRLIDGLSLPVRAFAPFPTLYELVGASEKDPLGVGSGSRSRLEGSEVPTDQHSGDCYRGATVLVAVVSLAVLERYHRHLK